MKILERQSQLNILHAKYGRAAADSGPAPISQNQVQSDQVIIVAASAAPNGEKFNDLFFGGKWQKYYSDPDTNKESCSEADLGLLNIIAYYTDSQEQAWRIFLASALGKRDKLNRPDIRSGLLKLAFDQKLKKVDHSSLRDQWEKSKGAKFPTNTFGELLEFNLTAEPTKFIWGGMPAADVSILASDGGLGKSTFAMQLLTSISAGRSFMGHATEKAPTVYVSAEDQKSVVSQRATYIADAYGLSKRNEFNDYLYRNFHLLEILGQALWQDQRGNTAGAPTSVMAEIEQTIVSTGSKIAVIDNVSSVYFSDHMSLVPVVAFITYLRSMATRTGCAIFLLAHVSSQTATKADAKGFYGSVGWHNTPRCRFLLEAIPAANGIAGYLQLVNLKNNYMPLMPPIRMYRGDNGILQSLENSQIAGAINKKIDSLAENILNQIKTLYAKGEFITAANQGPNTTVKALASHFPTIYDDKDQLLKKDVQLAIQKLESSSRILKRQIMTDNRKMRPFWVPADAP